MTSFYGLTGMAMGAGATSFGLGVPIAAVIQVAVTPRRPALTPRSRGGSAGGGGSGAGGYWFSETTKKPPRPPQDWIKPPPDERPPSERELPPWVDAAARAIAESTRRQYAEADRKRAAKWEQRRAELETDQLLQQFARRAAATAARAEWEQRNAELDRRMAYAEAAQRTAMSEEWEHQSALLDKQIVAAADREWEQVSLWQERSAELDRRATLLFTVSVVALVVGLVLLLMAASPAPRARTF